jgi:hypothetical protein
MATDQLTPLLLDAKREYVGQLTDVMAPYVLSFLANLRATSPTLVDFQHRLREIPVWNSNVVAQRTQEIEGRFPYLNDLIAAVFVSYTKILSSIKLGEDKPNIRLRLPDRERLLHDARAGDDPQIAQRHAPGKSDALASVETLRPPAVRVDMPCGTGVRGVDEEVEIGNDHLPISILRTTSSSSN